MTEYTIDRQRKAEFLKETIQHFDMKSTNVVDMVDSMEKMAFQARNLARGAKIFNMMQEDKDCAVFLTLAGSLISSGLKLVITDMIRHNMVDVIVSTGANIVDQDFFEALGFKHYIGTQYGIDDQELRQLMIDRIYDTFIDEEDLRICDDTIAQICNMLPINPTLPANSSAKWDDSLMKGKNMPKPARILSSGTATKKVYPSLYLLFLIALPVSVWFTTSGITPIPMSPWIQPRISLKSPRSNSKEVTLGCS
jgi:predicted SpoU family rRNA methylase